MEIRRRLAIVLAFLVGFALSNPGQYLVNSDQRIQGSEPMADNLKSSSVVIDGKLAERMCSRMGNWSYAKWAHEWWSNNPNAQLVMDGHSPRNFSANFEVAWAKVYQNQMDDLKAMGCP